VASTVQPLMRQAFLTGETLSEKKWAVREGKPRCKNCDFLLQPVDEPLALKCVSCGRTYPLTDSELDELTFDLSD